MIFSVDFQAAVVGSMWGRRKWPAVFGYTNNRTIIGSVAMCFSMILCMKYLQRMTKRLKFFVGFLLVVLWEAPDLYQVS